MEPTNRHITGGKRRATGRAQLAMLSYQATRIRGEPPNCVTPNGTMKDVPQIGQKRLVLSVIAIIVAVLAIGVVSIPTPPRFAAQKQDQTAMAKGD